MEQPGDGDLRGGRPMSFSKSVENAARLGQLSGRQWKPGDKCDFVLRTIVNYVFVSSVNDVVLVLNAHHRHDLLRSLNVGHRSLRNSNVPNLIFIPASFLSSPSDSSTG